LNTLRFLRRAAPNETESLHMHLVIDSNIGPSWWRTPRGRCAMWILVVLGWCGLVTLCAAKLYSYETTAGASRTTPTEWPERSALHRGEGFTVVMFVHPECPCSRASLAELRAVADSATSAARTEVVFVGGEGDGSSWGLAGRIRNVERVVDGDRVEAEHFGAMTSGHVVVYDPAGHLVFSGGITGSRGHVGDNVGRRQVLAVLDGGKTQHTHAVFGCELQDP
jgi:hypothetical protein